MLHEYNPLPSLFICVLSSQGAHGVWPTVFRCWMLGSRPRPMPVLSIFQSWTNVCRILQSLWGVSPEYACTYIFRYSADKKMEVGGWFVAEFNCCYWTDSEKADVALFVYTEVYRLSSKTCLTTTTTTNRQTNKKIYKESSVCYIMSAYVSKINIQLFYYNK